MFLSFFNATASTECYTCCPTRSFLAALLLFTPALGLLLVGARGNILDRVRFGFVFYFLDLHIGEGRPFLVFNLADAAISIGVVILLIRALFSRSDRRPAGEIGRAHV